MSIEADLRKDGIEVTSIIPTEKVKYIAKKVANILVDSFPEHNFNAEELYIALSQIPMYRASVPKGFSEANYFYKNRSIYFNENITTNDLIPYAIHECIHYLQTRKDIWGNLSKLGLCTVTRFSVHGLAINEAAVQYITSKALASPVDTVKYYGIKFDTISPNCYPVVCNLIAQMSYITGEYVLLNSTFNSNNDFKNTFIRLTSYTTYEAIERNFDNIVQTEEDLIKITNQLEHSKDTEHSLQKQVLMLKQRILDLYIQTQNIIITSYFEKALTEIFTINQLEAFRTKLYNFKPLIGIIDGENFYNVFYTDMMIKLENRSKEITEGNLISKEHMNTLPVKTNTNFFANLLKKLYKIIFKPISEFINFKN